MREWRNPFSPEARAESDRRDALQKALLPRLIGGLWHTTSPDHFQGIRKGGAILPGEISKSYARDIGGVSLFDFEGFDPEAFSAKYPTIPYLEFVPYQSCWGCAAVWIEIDPEKIASQLISGRDLWIRRKAENATSRLMAYIEAAHLGPLPVEAFRQVLLVRKEDANIQSLDLPKR